MQKVSRLFCPALITPKNAVLKPVEAQSRSQKLLIELGLVKATNNGTFQLLPLAQRALDKCIALVDNVMQRTVQAQKITLPILTSTKLWQKSGRLNGDVTEFFQLRDRQNKSFLLSPTHEEVITALLATAAPISYRQLPIRLYQIGPKFRDELKARFGLLRAKEFIMKDLYTFDRNLTEAHATYALIQDAYKKFFKQLQVPYARVAACTGIMGGELSHEFHYLADIGEDQLLHCQDCGHAVNIELQTGKSCVKCKSHNLKETAGIELAHTFLLGDKYSQPFGATFLPEQGKPQTLIMGCYGIGISRLLAAALEVLSTETQLRWPTLLSPYDVCVIGPKEGSKEEKSGADQVEQQVCQKLIDLNIHKDVVWDDRKYLTIGKRLLDAKKLGYPLIVVVGSKAIQEPQALFELHTYNDIQELSLDAVLEKIKNYRMLKSKFKEIE